MDAFYPLYNYPTEVFHYRDPDPGIDALTHVTPWDYMDWDEGEDNPWMEDDSWMEEDAYDPWLEEDLMGDVEWDETSWI